MLSVIVKTVIIFLLVIIVVHLVIQKTLDVSPPPPLPKNAEFLDTMDEVFQKTNDDAPIVHSSTGITPPLQPQLDDLFNYVYKDTADKSPASPPPPPVTASTASTNPDTNTGNTNIKGLCEFEDGSQSLYCTY
jgi:hypothetical protein